MALFLLRMLWSAIWGALCAVLSCLWPFRAKPPDLSADVCVVTGAGQGLGRHLALQLAADCGATVVLWDVNGEKVRAVAREITEAGGTAHAYVVDCSVREEVYRAADLVRDEVGDVAVLINNAAVGGFRGSFVDGSVNDETITKTFSVQRSGCVLDAEDLFAVDGGQRLRIRRQHRVVRGALRQAVRGRVRCRESRGHQLLHDASLRVGAGGKTRRKRHLRISVLHEHRDNYQS